MHSFHRSRGRIVFEALCALTVVLSIAGTWLQTGAWALLPAGAAGLALAAVRLSDLAGAGPASVEPPQAAEFDEPTLQQQEPTGVARAAAEAPIQVMQVADMAVAGAATVEDGAAGPEVPAMAARTQKKRTPRKGGKEPNGTGKRAAASERSLPPADAIASEETVADEDDAILSAFPPPSDPVRIEPLFDPEPHLRQQRAVFGRKSG